MKSSTSISLMMAIFAQTFILAFGRISYDGLVLTSIDVKPVAGTENTIQFSGSIKGRGDDDTATFLENVRQVNDKDKDGARLFEAEKVSVRRAKELIDGGYGGKPLFCVHGFNVQPGSHLKDCQKHQGGRFNKGKFTLVPVIWPSEGGVDDYGGDREINAPGAGKAFRTLKNGIDSFPSKSLLCHSMGNRVLKFAADAKFKFDNIYMAAADVRHDLFHASYIRGSEDSPQERTSGLRICGMLTKNFRGQRKGKVYVMTNGADYALTGSSWNPWTWKTRIGLIGNAREKNWWGTWRTNESLTDSEIRGCIENKFCNPFLPLTRKASHSYHFDDFAADFYREKLI